MWPNGGEADKGLSARLPPVNGGKPGDHQACQVGTASTTLNGDLVRTTRSMRKPDCARPSAIDCCGPARKARVFVEK